MEIHSEAGHLYKNIKQNYLELRILHLNPNSDLRQTTPFNLGPAMCILLGLKLVKLSILPTMSIHFVYGRLGELRLGYLGLKWLNGQSFITHTSPI